MINPQAAGRGAGIERVDTSIGDLSANERRAFVSGQIAATMFHTFLYKLIITTWGIPAPTQINRVIHGVYS
jgi:hypothetical protein